MPPLLPIPAIATVAVAVDNLVAGPGDDLEAWLLRPPAPPAAAASAQTMLLSLRWQTAAVARKREHIPNMTDRGYALTLYRIAHTNALSGMRKKLMMVARDSSGT